jgi:hypothetical protein
VSTAVWLRSWTHGLHLCQHCHLPYLCVWAGVRNAHYAHMPILKLCCTAGLLRGSDGGPTAGTGRFPPRSAPDLLCMEPCRCCVPRLDAQRCVAKSGLTHQLLNGQLFALDFSKTWASGTSVAAQQHRPSLRCRCGDTDHTPMSHTPNLGVHLADRLVEIAFAVVGLGCAERPVFSESLLGVQCPCLLHTP